MSLWYQVYVIDNNGIVDTFMNCFLLRSLIQVVFTFVIFVDPINDRSTFTCCVVFLTSSLGVFVFVFSSKRESMDRGAERQVLKLSERPEQDCFDELRSQKIHTLGVSVYKEALDVVVTLQSNIGRKVRNVCKFLVSVVNNVEILYNII